MESISCYIEDYARPINGKDTYERSLIIMNARIPKQ